MIQDALHRLLALQQKDLTLLQLKREAQGIPGRKEGLVALAGEAKAREAAAAAAVKSGESAIKQLEIEVQSLQGQVTRYRNQQLEIRNNESYRALEQEIQNTQATITAQEDRELEHMEALEAARRELESARAALAAADQRVAAEQEALDQRMEVIRSIFADLKQERDSLAALLEPEILQRYMAQLQNKQDAVVVPLRNQSCGGCHMRLTPQHVHDAHALQKWVTCVHCGRFLYQET